MLYSSVTAPAQSSALPAQAGVGVATTVHLNPMLMAVDRIGLQSAQISTQNIQPASMTAQGIQPAPIGVQGLHATAPISTQSVQQAPVATQQPQSEAKPAGTFSTFLSEIFNNFDWKILIVPYEICFVIKVSFWLKVLLLSLIQSGALLVARSPSLRWCRHTPRGRLQVHPHLSPPPVLASFAKSL